MSISFFELQRFPHSCPFGATALVPDDLLAALSQGAGVYLSANADVVIRDTRIRSNRAGLVSARYLKER